MALSRCRYRDRGATLYRLATRLAGQGNVLVEHSRRGAHLWLFGSPTPWEQVHAYGQRLIAEAELGYVELYPKSEGLHGVKLPGSRHPKSGVVYPAINPLTGEISAGSDPAAGISGRQFAAGRRGTAHASATLPWILGFGAGDLQTDALTRVWAREGDRSLPVAR